MASKHTKPKLWEKVKQEIKAGSKGGDPGQWTARKAQLAVQEYKKRGGGYKGKKQDNSLSQWSGQDWQYSSSRMKQKGGRYLPSKVWEQLTPRQKAITNKNKINGSGRVEYEKFVKKAFKKAGLKMS